MKPVLTAAWCLWLVGCAAAHSGSAGERAPKVASESSLAPVTSAPASPPALPSAALPTSAGAAPTQTEQLPLLKLKLIPLLSVPVKAIALGEGTRIAVLADTPYVGDARGLRPLPLPATLQPKGIQVDDVGIFFGRDNEPRIMGRRVGDMGARAVYLRHLPNGWRDGREEIGQLGGTTIGGLWGVLGSADPELVCRVGAICIIKRVSGWTTAPAGSVVRIVTLQDGVLWGLEKGGISTIDAQGWKLAVPAPAWSETQAFWATHGEAWVGSQAELFHYRAGKWQSVPSPVGRVTSFWGTRADSVWLVGSGGAAHFDGQRFYRIAIAGPLLVVRGRSDGELWFGGQEGLFRAEPADKGAE